MKFVGALIVALLAGVIALWLLVKLVFFGLKLIGFLIAAAIAVGVFLVARRAIAGPG